MPMVERANSDVAAREILEARDIVSGIPGVKGGCFFCVCLEVAGYLGYLRPLIVVRGRLGALWVRARSLVGPVLEVHGVGLGRWGWGIPPTRAYLPRQAQAWVGLHAVPVLCLHRLGGLPHPTSNWEAREHQDRRAAPTTTRRTAPSIAIATFFLETTSIRAPRTSLSSEARTQRKQPAPWQVPSLLASKRRPRDQRPNKLRSRPNTPRAFRPSSTCVYPHPFE